MLIRRTENMQLIKIIGYKTLRTVELQNHHAAVLALLANSSLATPF